mgnify:CR=1 FL=1
MSNTVSLPFFINAFVSSNIAEQVIARTGWRWVSLWLGGNWGEVLTASVTQGYG